MRAPIPKAFHALPRFGSTTKVSVSDVNIFVRAPAGGPSLFLLLRSIQSTGPPKIHNVHEVATLLKMYFRELPDPVVPTPHYHTMLEASVKVRNSKCNQEEPRKGRTGPRWLVVPLAAGGGDGRGGD